MGIERVKEEIWSRAQKEALQRRNLAKEQVESMLKEAKNIIKEFKDQQSKLLIQQKEDIEKREIASARLEARKKVLEFKKSALEDTFSKANQKLKSLPEARRKEFLSMLFEKAKNRIAIVSLQCSAKDKKFFKGVNIKQREISGGFIAENSDNSLQINYSYDSLLDLIKERNLSEIAETLFENKNKK